MSSGKLQARTLVRAQPFLAEDVYPTTLVTDGDALRTLFEIAAASCDRNELKGADTDSPDGNRFISTVGPLLDFAVFSTKIGVADIRITFDIGCTTVSMLSAPIPIPALTLVIIASGLRIPARWAETIFTNTSGDDAVVDYFAAIRSN